MKAEVIDITGMFTSTDPDGDRLESRQMNDKPRRGAKRPIRRRLRNLQINDYRLSAEIYSETRPGTGVSHKCAIDAQTGEFWCSCEHHQYHKAFCKHLSRLAGRVLDKNRRIANASN